MWNAGAPQSVTSLLLEDNFTVRLSVEGCEVPLQNTWNWKFLSVFLIGWEYSNNSIRNLAVALVWALEEPMPSICLLLWHNGSPKQQIAFLLSREKLQMLGKIAIPLMYSFKVIMLVIKMLKTHLILVWLALITRKWASKWKAWYLATVQACGNQ